MKPLTGPGRVYDSASAIWPGKGPDRFDYAVDEYVISGTVAGDPYKARLVIRRPKDARKFSGVVVATAARRSNWRAELTAPDILCIVRSS